MSAFSILRPEEIGWDPTMRLYCSPTVTHIPYLINFDIKNYNSSLTEHRTPDVLNKLRATERAKTESARKAYIDPAKAEEAREEGNKKFKENDYPGAVAAYSEMIKRAPEDPRGYSNRAAAFIKLFEFPSAVDDCNAAIKQDPKFIRAYIRKAQAYHGMRKYSECVDACTEALEVDMEHHNGTNAREIEQQQQKAFGAMYSARDNETEEQTRERLMNDPDVSAGDGPFEKHAANERFRS